MDKRSVVWTETAARQRREILKYWTLRNHSTQYAEKLIILTKKRINLILKNTSSYKLTNYPNTRESAMGHFSIYYKLLDEKLIITAFWDNRQDPKKMLDILTK
ncbi:type II toxin-antitoxin system RelE/ParE family toxin [Pedobacter cryophilus]|uniref:Type II toxin-antitoxin system RelE/ParE family toxin n=1 Tax=Pedobacter cryophilus TaxID=2571271 RepID=A0A4U1BVW1_9SPHI|nr:type II toxin-antitoxin system RelE/ParE family toxin [Pedobacter cryophilus]TKB96955.1 type II toxin-antitoxin system RelE/ParE family toxin [Pedobacter cryophilus]